MERNSDAISDRGRIMRFRARAGPRGSGAGDRGAVAPLPSPPRALSSPVEDVGLYERRSTERDDYAHRMLVNAAALVVSALLVASGVWIAVKMAELRKDQDCVLSGRRNCAQVQAAGPIR